MNISYMKAEMCPECGNILDFFETFSTTGKVCRACGWKTEWYTGLISDFDKYKDEKTGQTISVRIKHHDEVCK